LNKFILEEYAVSTLTMETEYSCETLENFYPSTWGHTETYS